MICFILEENMLLKLNRNGSKVKKKMGENVPFRKKLLYLLFKP